MLSDQIPFQCCDDWSQRNRWLNQLEAAVGKATQGRFRDLVVGWEDPLTIVEARSSCYYGVQLALATCRDCLATRLESERMPGHAIRLTTVVKGHWMEFYVVDRERSPRQQSATAPRGPGLPLAISRTPRNVQSNRWVSETEVSPSISVPLHYSY
ncbi:hypothetical protein [Novipirellula artificiosorum]|uniref:Uncharacterized protein n=1 Tax=Novipirellula artificiosorum TaxID=2528016 RepID=A0A5C6DSF8_9BACT|nr:hypothetical protein [Novipirellula artificiosorum]TWU39195.1 hypothetical protein Poly41_20170 [Novipirellula artificiosorum]